MNGKARQVPAAIGVPGGQAQQTAHGPFNPRDIPLTAHAQIQLDAGTPLIAPQPVSFPAGL